ncbi:MAG: peptide chain release factor N(5)-glutamine methyltransferase [Omnitrophica bacterium]|nr:peptide chain release factor N(5)-glutamine methyltransferase [Candidatus Omnitrophota bacterium]
MAKVAHFMDFEFETGNTTLFPRFETEVLVEKAVSIISKEIPEGERCEILDIGTGCGNIAISLTNYIPSSRIVALDISEMALSVAKKNAVRYGMEQRIEFVKSDLFENLWQRSELSFDLVISNPPYISLADFTSLPEAVKEDPYVALYGGRDGMDFYRRIVNEAHFFMKRGAVLLTEVGYDQASCVKAMLETSGVFGDAEIYKDYSGIDRIVKGRKNG